MPIQIKVLKNIKQRIINYQRTINDLQLKYSKDGEPTPPEILSKIRSYELLVAELQSLLFDVIDMELDGAKCYYE